MQNMNNCTNSIKEEANEATFLFQKFTPMDIFKLHRDNFYYYLNVEDHLEII
jgi:hypothetical protein